MPNANGPQDDPTSQPSRAPGPPLDGDEDKAVSPGGDPGTTRQGGPEGVLRESIGNLDAAFYHESASFHHSRAAHYIDVGLASVAERHIWAAYGHSLNAHESTRACVNALHARAPRAGDGPAGGAA